MVNPGCIYMSKNRTPIFIEKNYFISFDQFLVKEP